MAWRQGPNQDRQIDAHDRQINCLAVRGDEFVSGSSDHSLSVYSCSTGKLKRQLYSKNYGHHEWVTSCCYTADGRILSGGMDSKLCLWDRNSIKCKDLLGHRGSISKVACSQENLALSASYDKTLKVWDVDKGSLIHTLYNSNYGHTKAIRTFLWKNSLVVSGGREGLGCVWDLNSGKLVSTFDEHSAPIQCMCLSPNEDLVMTAGMDGFVCAWDLRSSKLVKKIDVKASVNDIAVYDNGVVVGCVDNLIKTIDTSNMEMRKLKGHKDIVTCVRTHGDLVLSGAANGWVLVHDVNTGQCLYGVSSCDKGCQAIEIAAPKHFITAGMDGKIVVFDYFSM
mmetsp:Transcript_12701/g.19082  ORF Transcript_12701/g.19082 Transcript_12701/m.19082 type:complete len:338 (-) Transcript_12701:28-1041(-)